MWAGEMVKVILLKLERGMQKRRRCWTLKLGNISRRTIRGQMATTKHACLPVCVFFCFCTCRYAAPVIVSLVLLKTCMSTLAAGWVSKLPLFSSEDKKSLSFKLTLLVTKRRLFQTLLFTYSCKIGWILGVYVDVCVSVCLYMWALKYGEFLNLETIHSDILCCSLNWSFDKEETKVCLWVCKYNT